MGSVLTVAEAANAKPLDINGFAFTAGFFFSFRLCITLLSVLLFGMEPSTGTGISLGLDLLLLALVCFSSLGGIQSGSRLILRLPTVRWVLLFLMVACCSLAWSETESLVNSFAYWFGLVTDVTIVVVLLRAGPVIEVSHSLMKGFIWSACCLALVAWIMPTQSDLRLGDELYFNTNEIGNLCAFGIFFAQYLMQSKDGKWRLPIVLLVITLLRSLSKTTLTALLISELFFIARDQTMSRKTKIWLAVFAGILIFGFWGLFESYYDIYTTTGNQAETLTGRTAIWLYIANATFDHPWTMWVGHGFDSWWKVVPPFAGGQFEARHGENELLQQFYAYGLIGVFMLIGLYGSLYRALRKLRRGPQKLLFLSILLFILVRGLAEADSFDLLLPLWSIVLISVLVDYEGGNVKPSSYVDSTADATDH